MKPRRTSVADAIPIRVAIVTLDSHLASTIERAQIALRRALPGLTLTLHAAADWPDDAAALDRCKSDIEQADIVIANMLFMEDHVQAILPALRERRGRCDAMVCGMSAPEIVHLTQMGRFRMDEGQGGALALLKRLRGSRERTASSGAHQLRMLKRIPRLLRFIPGTAQDVRVYLLTLQYWLAASEENVEQMIRLLVDRYAAGDRSTLKGKCPAKDPVEYPSVGVYHPRMKERITTSLARLPACASPKGTVGILLMRSYVLAGNTQHYDAVIERLEAKGLRVVPAFASGLDARPAIEQFFVKDGHSTIDALVSLTGFSLVGGPAYNDAAAAEKILEQLDVPYIAAQPLEFQTLDQWQSSERGLLPVEATMMVAIPELDGATGSMVFGGRSGGQGGPGQRDMRAHPERIAMLADRVSRWIDLRAVTRAKRKVAVVLFSFPPQMGNAGTAAHLSVFASLYRTLTTLQTNGYTVDLPASEDELRTRLLHGNAATYGSIANVHARIPIDEHVRRERWLTDIEAQWGPAPGRDQTDGRSLFVLGAQFGNVFVGLQPGFGYEGDPMRLMFEKGFAPTHAFSAFYRHLREDFGADAVLHFGTHGALEFMPGKQTGLSGDCWPDRLIGDLPNVYLYAANNPSEGTIAKRRAAATLVSYLTPPIAHAGLYRGLLDLRSSIDRWRSLDTDAQNERENLALLIQSQAAELDLGQADPPWGEAAGHKVIECMKALDELERTLIPSGLHVMGEPMSAPDRIDMLAAINEANNGPALGRDSIGALVSGAKLAAAARLVPAEIQQTVAVDALRSLESTNQLLAEDYELPAVLRALDGSFIAPVAGGDVLRTPAILPTGRNLRGFDPYRMPSAFAMSEGTRQVDRLLERHASAQGSPPQSIAIVLWGTDNLKSEGGPIAQALALFGARPRFDAYGRLCGAALIPLEELGRPRIDAVITLSGIFRDLLPLQTTMLAEAAYLAASADEPEDRNFVRRHALAYQAQHGCDLETAALRVFSNDESAYGSNVNHLVHNGQWQDEDELAEIYTRRKSFAYGRNGRPTRHGELLQTMLADVDLSYQNLESIEVGVTTLDHYFDTLGGISRAVRRAKGEAVPVYIGDPHRGEGVVRTLSEQVALETRTRMLNPKWYEGMLQHGYEGVRQIEEHLTNTMGWSATTGQVAPWVYRQITQTFVLDPVMRERLAALNPAASARVASRLLEAHERRYWDTDDAMLDALRKAGEALEDRLEGVEARIAA